MSRRPDMNRAASMAYRLLIRAEVTALPVDPLALLRRCRDTQVCTYVEAADWLGLTDAEMARRFGPAEAFTLRQETDGLRQYMVVYQTGGNPARQRFTLAHELGHRVLGHQGKDPAEEQEADCFASHLLCPRPVIARLAERFRPLYAEQVADACYVSLSCARNLTDAVDVPDELTAQVDALLKDAALRVEPVAAQRTLHRYRVYPE